jgi:L-rhamnose mutarotase
MEIYRFKNRLMMIMELNDDFDAERKSAMDSANDKVKEWESLMWKYQQAVPGAKPGEKWMLMNKIFEL